MPASKTVELPFTVIRDTADLYGWRIEYFDHGIGHDGHTFTNGAAVAVVVHYRARTAVYATFTQRAGETYLYDATRSVAEVMHWLERYGRTPETACVAWRDAFGVHREDRVTDPMSYAEACEFAVWASGQTLVAVQDVHLVSASKHGGPTSKQSAGQRGHAGHDTKPAGQADKAETPETTTA